MKKESNWIDNIFDSLEQAEKAIPSNSFLDKIERLALAYATPINKISKKSVVAIAASVLILIALNFSIVSNYIISSPEESLNTQVSASYKLIPIKTLYNE